MVELLKEKITMEKDGGIKYVDQPRIKKLLEKEGWKEQKAEKPSKKKAK